MSYPGGVWRYSVEAGSRRFVVDAQRRFAAGESVRVVLPAGALHLFPAGGARAAQSASTRGEVR